MATSKLHGSTPKWWPYGLPFKHSFCFSFFGSLYFSWSLMDKLWSLHVVYSKLFKQIIHIFQMHVLFFSLSFVVLTCRRPYQNQSSSWYIILINRIVPFKYHFFFFFVDDVISLKLIFLKFWTTRTNLI